MSRLYLLLGLTTLAASEPVDGLSASDARPLGTLKEVRDWLSSCYPEAEWEKLKAVSTVPTGTLELSLDPGDLTSVSLRITGRSEDQAWLSRISLKPGWQLYDAQTGDWFAFSPPSAALP